MLEKTNIFNKLVYFDLNLNIKLLVYDANCRGLMVPRSVQLNTTFRRECHWALVTVINKLSWEMLGLHMVPDISFPLV